MLDRRTFLRRLGFGSIGAAAAAITAFDVERLLWLSGEKTICVPPAPEVFRSLTYQAGSINWVVKEALEQLQRTLKVSPYFTAAPQELRELRFITVSLDGRALDRCRTAEEARARVIDPAVNMLAEGIRASGMNVFLPQELPRGVEQAAQWMNARGLLSVRGLKYFDIIEHQSALRLDVCGGKA